MKQIYIFLVCLLAFLNVNAQDKVMTIDNQTPGWLSSKMTYAQQVAVEDLTITGYINPTDMKFVNGLINQRKLKVLNINQVHLVDDNNNDDVLWQDFIDCRKPLQKLVMPSTLVYNGSSSLDATNIDSLIIDADVLASRYLERFPKHLLLTEHITRIPSSAFVDNESSIEGRCVITLPSSIEEIGASAIVGLKLPTDDFVLPKNIVRLGSPSDNENSWYLETVNSYRNGIDMPISSSRFEFPESLKAYHGGWTSSSLGGYHYKWAQHCYTSDTIVVGSKCDTLEVRLKAKVAYFETAVPPQGIYAYKIDKLYVPKGSLDVYKKKYGENKEIKEIEEIKTIENIALRYTSPHKMLKEESCELFDKIQPADAFDKRIKWSSSNEEVATVDANGVATAHKNGTATITVSSYDGSVTNSCEIIVAQPVTGVSIDPAEIEMHNLGDRAQLSNDKKITWYIFVSFL